MVEYSAFEDSELDVGFRALADPTRRAMLHALARGTHTVSGLAAPHEISLAAASKHVKTLERAGLLRREIRGRKHYCRLEPKGMRACARWVSEFEAFWTSRLDSLEQVLRAEAEAAETGTATKERPRMMKETTE